MNKLTSKNPVLRFKLGRKIIKALEGTQTYYEVTERPKITITKPKEEQTHDYYRRIHNGKWTWGTVDNNGKFIPITKEVILNDGTILNINGTRSSVSARNAAKNAKVIERGYIDANGNKTPLNTSINTSKTLTSHVNPKFYIFGKMGGWNSSMGSSIDQDSLNMLKEMGYNIDNIDARTIQNDINTAFGSNAVKADNRWGNLSRAGLEALYKRWKDEQSLTTGTKTTVTQPSITQPSITKTPEFLERLRQLFIKEETPEQLVDRAIINNVDNLQFKRNGNYNRSGIRDLIRSYGLRAYDFTGSLRKALKQYLNGESDDTSLLTNGLERFIVPYKQGGQLILRNMIERFKQGKKLIKALNGISFKQAWNDARNKKLRYFNWTDANGVTRMYNSKAAGNDSAYESFVDNMNEMSALLPTNRQPKHLGWDRNNPTSSELRGKDRQINKQGTESTLLEVTVIGTKKSKPVSKASNSNNSSKNKNRATRNMSGAWGQGSGGGLQYANQRQYAFERSDFDKMRMKSAGIFGSTGYKVDSRGKRYVERDGNIYYEDGTYYSPETRKTGRYTFTPGGLFSKNVFTLYKLGGILPSRNIVKRFKNRKFN